MKKIIIILSFIFCTSLFAQGTRKFELSVGSNYTPYKPTGKAPELVVQEWHDSGYSKYISYCNDNKYIFSTSESDVKLWDARTGYLLKSFSKNIKYPEYARIAPNASYFIYQNEKGGIDICDMADNRLTIFNLFKIPSEDEYIVRFAFSQDGNYIALSYYDKVVVFNANTLRREYVLESSEFIYHDFEMSFSADGKYLSTIVKPVEILQQQKLGKFINVIWNVREQEVEKINASNTAASISAVAISPDGKFAALSSEDGNLSIFNLLEKKWENVFKITEKDAPVHSLSFNLKTNELISVDKLGYVQVWNIHNGKELFCRESTFVEKNTHFMNLTNSVYDSSGETFAYTNGNTIELRDSKTYELLKEIGQSSDMKALSYNLESGYLCAFYPGKGIPLLFDDVNFFNCYYDLRTLSKDRLSVPVVITDGLYYVNRENNQSILKMYDIASEYETDIMVLENFHHRNLFSDAYGRIIAYLSTEIIDSNTGSKLRLYDVSKKSKIYELPFSDDVLFHDVKVSNSGKFVVVNDGKEIIFINTQNNSQKRVSAKGPASIRSMSFSSNDDYCAFIDNDKYVVYETAGWIKKASYDNGIKSCFSSDNKLLAINFQNDDSYTAIYNFNTGKVMKHIPMKYVASLNFTKDGKRLICQSINGIIKCYSVETGELLSCTIANTYGDWLTYTPEGYFTGSEGGINKFVHLVDGMQVFELGQMYDTLYRPDLVQAKLEGKDIGKPVLKELVATGDAPHVQFTKTPLATSREVTLEFSVQDSGGGIGYVYLSHNGKAMQVSAGEKSKLGERYIYTCDVTLAKGENVFEAYAANSANKIESCHAVISLNWQGKIENANLYVLAMGVDQYTKMPKNNLSYSVADATAIVESFKNSPGGLYGSVNVMTLLDSDVNKANIQKAFNSFSAKVSPDDMFVLHIAGHGVNYDGEYYFLPADTIAKTDADFVSQGVSKHFLTENLSKIQALNTVVLLDTCYSGAFIDAKASGNSLSQKTALEHLAHTSGQVILTASANFQTAGEGYSGHGIFTYAIMEALSGKANYNADSTVSIKEIAQYIGYEIPNIYEKMGAERQSPWNSPLRGDFSVVAYGKRLPSKSTILSLNDNAKQIQWVTKRIDDTHSDSKQQVAKKESESKTPVIQKKDARNSKKEVYGRSKGMNLVAGYAKGAVFDGFDIGTQIYFLGGKHFFAGAEADFIFNSVGNKSADTDKFTLMNIDAVLGLSASLGHFRPYAQGGLGFYTAFVPDSKTDTTFTGLSLQGAVGSDIVFGKFYIGGAYKLLYLNGSGYVDNYIMNIGWNW